MPSFAAKPTSPYYAFDHNVFDMGFLVMDIVPTLDRAIVERGFQLVESGQAVVIVASIQDIMTTLGQRYQFNPGTTPQIEIYNPDDTVKVPFADMNFIGSVGYYNYQHQTGIGGTMFNAFDPVTFDEVVFATGSFFIEPDQIGVYKARFKAINGTMSMLSDKLAVFKLMPQ